jgi:hypothetical protein
MNLVSHRNRSIFDYEMIAYQEYANYLFLIQGNGWLISFFPPKIKNTLKARTEFKSNEKESDALYDHY